VHLALPLIHWKGVRYSVTPACVGQLVLCREEVDSGTLSITFAGKEIGRHELAPPGSPDIWDPEHREDVEAAALGQTRPTFPLLGPARLTPRPANPWGWHGLTDIHHKAHSAGKDVHHGDHGTKQAP